MTNVWCVRADYGTYTKAFLDGSYVAIGWIPDVDLGHIKGREELYPLYRTAYPDDKSNIVIGQQVGQIGRFLLEIKAGDYVITPAADTEWLHYGRIADDPSYFHQPHDAACPFAHRRRVHWNSKAIRRGDFSVPFQNTIRSSLTVFAISQSSEFLHAIGQAKLAPAAVAAPYDPYLVVLQQVLELDDKEFEILV